MNKLISSTISILTSAAVLMCSELCLAFADNEETVYFDSEFAEVSLSDFNDLSINLSNQPKILSNFKNGFYNYGDTLEGNNLDVYNAFMKLDEPTNEPFTVKLTNAVTIKLEHSDPSKFSDKDSETYQEALFNNCKPGIDCALFDRPELYWIDPMNISIAVGTDTTIKRDYLSGEYTIKMRSLIISPSWLSGFTSKENAVEYGKLLEEALEKVPVDGTNRYETILNVHDYISKFTYYDLNAKFSSSALGALVEPGVVCEGYSEAFKIICDRLDIPCVCVFGNLIEEDNAGHMWNYVQMEDGKWYGIDVTWDDLDGKGGKEIKYEHFLKGSKNFYIKHFPITDYKITQLVYPEISKSDFDPSIYSEILTTTTTTAPVITTTTTTTLPLDSIEGDLNHDGEVNIADLVYCQSSLLAKIKPHYSCDANADGVVDIFDIIYMRKLLI